LFLFLIALAGFGKCHAFPIFIVLFIYLVLIMHTNTSKHIGKMVEKGVEILWRESQKGKKSIRIRVLRWSRK